MCVCVSVSTVSKGEPRRVPAEAEAREDALADETLVVRKEVRG